MKLDIENKILIPFVILLVLSIISIGVVSYWNGYQLLLNNEMKNAEARLDNILLFMDNINEDIRNGMLLFEDAREKVLQYYSGIFKEELIFIEGREVLLGQLANQEIVMEALSDNSNIDKTGTNIYTMKNATLIYKIYEEWDWIIGHVLRKTIISQDVLEVQKYTILVAIVFLLFSMQAAIFIAHNISKPVKKLADACNKIAKGNFKHKLEINRKDEIGILAEAFNNMLYQLQANTAKLLEITKFNEDMLRNISTGIITTNKTGDILSINETAKKVLQYDTEKPAIKENLIKQLKETLTIKRNINEVHVFDDLKKGEKLYLDVTTSLLKTEAGYIQGAICSFNDISERKKIENNMERLDRLTSVGQLAAGIAHEIRNPLAGMKTSIQVLKNRFKNFETPSNIKLFDGVVYEIDKINNLITDLLNFAKPRLPKYELIDIKQILKQSLYLTNKDIMGKNIDVEVEINTEESLVWVDKVQMEQIFLNIIKNAIRAMDGEGKLSVSVERIFYNERWYLSIVLNDNGCGIEEKNLDKVFNPFFTTNYQGTGLGLSVVYELVKENHGTIHINSIIDEGTEVTIRFPLSGGVVNEEKDINY